MTTDNLDSLVQEVAVERALDALKDPATPDDTPLLVSSNIDGQRVALISMVDGLTRPSIPRIHAKRVLSKMIPGTKLPAFWIPGMPGSPPTPERGSIKCMLHPDFEEEHGPAGFGRTFVNEAGLEGFFCNRGDQSKQNRGDFQSVFDRDEHMRSKHSRQFEVIQKAQGTQEDIDAKSERSIDRELQQAQVAATQEQAAAMLEAVQALMKGQATPAGAALEHLNAEGLRAYADKQDIALTNRQSVTTMREEIEAAS